MSSKHRLTRSFRTFSAIIYTADLLIALRFAWTRRYLHILVGALTGFVALLMFCVALEAPKMVTDQLEGSKLGEHLFTFRGRYMADLFIALFLFAMGTWGICLGALTLILIFSIRFLGVKQPDAFNEIFRQSDGESQSDSYTLESEYDTPVAADRR